MKKQIWSDPSDRSDLSDQPHRMGRRGFMRFAGAFGAVGAALSGATSVAGAAPEVAPKGVAFREVARIPLDVTNPSALAVGRDGKVYAACEDVVVVLDAQGRETARFSVKGRPGCMAVAPDGKLLIGLRNHVEVLDTKGAPVATWPDLGERAYLTSIVADEDNVFAADAGNRIVLRFDKTGNVQTRIGKRDPERHGPGLVVPSPYFDVALDPMGSLWVVNPGRHGFENYRPNGDLVSSWYRSGMDAASFCGCCNPIHIAFRSDSSLVTAEKGLSRVKVYGPDTKLVGVVFAPEGPAPHENESLFCNVEPPIMDLAVDAQDRILVLNKPEKAILVFEQTQKEQQR